MEVKLKRDFIKALNAVNGDGSRPARFHLLSAIDAAKKDFSTPDVCGAFDQIAKKHDKAAVALCVASTIWLRREAMEAWQRHWAALVIGLWTNRRADDIERANINDNLHPTRILQYAMPIIAGSIDPVDGGY